MRKLTRRELILIYIAVVLLIIYVSGILFALPAWRRMEAAQNRLFTLEMERETAVLELSGLASLRETCIRKEANYTESQAGYGTVASDANLEQTVLSCLERAGLNAAATSITSDTIQKTVNGRAVSLRKGAIEVTASGDRTGCLNVLDEVNQNPLWYLEEYTIFPAEGYDGAGVRLKLVYEMPQLRADTEAAEDREEEVS